VSGPTRTCPCSINFTACTCVSNTPQEGKCTHGADSLCHLGHAHDDSETASTEGSDGELVVDVAELGSGGEHAHVEKFGEQLGLHRGTEGILGRKKRESVGMLAERTTELVVSR
jgi:hypothetical protein